MRSRLTLPPTRSTGAGGVAGGRPASAVARNELLDAVLPTPPSSSAPARSKLPSMATPPLACAAATTRRMLLCMATPLPPACAAATTRPVPTTSAAPSSDTSAGPMPARNEAAPAASPSV
eukprot:366312-Chlamydomonas_euryale.AAC.4